MSLSSLSAQTDFGFGPRVPARSRRALHDVLDGKAPDAPIGDPPPAEDNPFDAAYYASRFKADLFKLKPPERAGDAPPPEAAAADSLLFEFFGALSVLLVSVRNGDIERARAAADMLSMEVMIERSSGETGQPHMLEDLRQMLTAAQSGDEPAARAAAKSLARDVERVLEPPPAQQAPEPAPSAAADATGAAYDTLSSAYLEDDAAPPAEAPA